MTSIAALGDVVGHTLDALGRRQLLLRDYLARLLHVLHQDGAAAVGLYVTLQTLGDPAEDAALARVIVEFSENGPHRSSWLTRSYPSAVRSPIRP